MPDNDTDLTRRLSLHLGLGSMEVAGGGHVERTVTPEEHSRRSRLHNIAVASVALADRFKDDKEKPRIGTGLLRR